MKKVVIFGAGGHAHVVADIIRAEGNEVVAFLDDDLAQEDCTCLISEYQKFSGYYFVIGIGDAETREKLSKFNLKWHTAIHPSAVVSPSAIIGEGTVIMPNAVINARTIIGKHSIINTGAIVEHDNHIGNYAHISVGVNLGGTVTIGDKTWIGIGSVIRNNVSICDSVYIGSGSNVIKDISVSGIYYGNPAHKE